LEEGLVDGLVDGWVNGWKKVIELINS
jgi:hypothetical protein